MVISCQWGIVPENDGLPNINHNSILKIINTILINPNDICRLIKNSRSGAVGGKYWRYQPKPIKLRISKAKIQWTIVWRRLCSVEVGCISTA
jgi:hypothetical protein